MACACKNKRERFTVKLPGGLTITKSTQAAALDYAAKHPGAKVEKKAA